MSPPVADFLQGKAKPILHELLDSGTRIAMAHYGFGFDIKEKDVVEVARLGPLIARIMQPKGLIVSDQPPRGFSHITGPDSIAADRISVLSRRNR